MLKKLYLSFMILSACVFYSQSTIKFNGSGDETDKIHFRFIETSINQFLQKSDSSFISLFFREDEASEFRDTLISCNYPGIDSSFNQELFQKSQVVKHLIQSFYSHFSQAKIIYTQPIFGFNEKVRGYLLTLTFTDEKQVNLETVSFLTIFFKNELKIISLKDEK